MKNVGEEPVLFDDAMTGAPRRVNPGEWVYVFEKQAGMLEAAELLERAGG